MKQYLKLLMVREGKEVLGKRCSNLWLLTIVLVATFVSIAFSEGSMNYLSYKMLDPFTNWVDIPVNFSDPKFKVFAESINKSDIKDKYMIDDVHSDREEYYDMDGGHFLRCRHFGNVGSSLISKILEDENVIGGCKIDTIVERSLGVIISADALQRLGFSLNPDSIPAYVHYKAYNEGGDSLGLTLEEKKFLEIPWPVLAVVNRLPNNVDMMATNYLSEQPNNIKHPFEFLSHENYLSDLLYFIPGEVDEAKLAEKVRPFFPDSIQKYVVCMKQDIKQMTSWKEGGIYTVDFGEHTPKMSSQQWLAIDAKVQKALADLHVERIYNYDTDRSEDIMDKYISLSFKNVDLIRAFEKYAKDEYQIQLDMSLVASKENFSAVTRMAFILSLAMVIFSLVCIIMFMVNMLQSYFQKVKRNIGTFKAFGMNGGELIQVYCIILVLIVIAAVVMALAITYAIQCVLPLVGVAKEGFNYLDLWNQTTYEAAAIVLVSTIATVCIVMSRMLSQTPGDLIYDRN